MKNSFKLFLIISFLFSIFQTLLFAQTANNDTVLNKISVDELLRIKEYYNKKIDELRKEEEDSRIRGKNMGESFLGDRGKSLGDKDKVYIRIAEYYIEDAERAHEKKVDLFDKQMDEYDSLTVLFDEGKIDKEPQPPEFPKVDYTEAIKIYDKLLNEYPASDLADDALYTKAFLLQKMGKEAESRELYQEVIDKYPDGVYAPESYIQMAEYYFNPREGKSEEQSIVELEKAIKLYKKVLRYKNSKRYDEALYKLGWSYYKLAARDPKYYNDAISYFLIVAEDIEASKKLDPKAKISNPNVRDEAIEYVGISFTDENYTKNGVDKARRMLERLGDKDYGVDVMRAIGKTYQKIDENEKAIYAYRNLLEMYPDYFDAPDIKKNIVDMLYTLGRDQEAYAEREELFNSYNPESDWYKNLEESDIQDKIKYAKKAKKISESALRTNIVIDLEKAEELYSEGKPDATDQYMLFTDEAKTYLDTFPTDSNAYDINWTYAFALDARLGKFEKAYEEYIRVSNDYYLQTAHQQDAALNAVNVADTLVKMKYGKSDTVKINFADIAKLSPEELTPEESRLVEAYDNYIRLFPTGEYTPEFLAAAGAIYYNHKKFAEAKVYYQTLVKRFPGAEEKNLAMSSIMDSYFALGKFQDSEIIAKKIVDDPAASEEQRKFAKQRMAQAIFKNAEYLRDQGDYFEAANEFLRVYKDAPYDERLVQRALNNSGLNFQKAKDWVRAIETFDTLVVKYPESKYTMGALLSIADGYKELEQYDKAAATYERIFNKYPDSKDAEPSLYNASYYYVKAEDWNNAIRINDKYIATYPAAAASVDLYFDKAKYYLKLDNIVEANKVYEQFALKYPDDPRTIEAFYERGNYYLENGQPELAKAEYNKAIARSEQFRKAGKDANMFIAGEAVNKLAEILHKEYVAIELKQPESNINAQKERMKSLLGELLTAYKKVLSFGSARSFEATYNMAYIYEEFADKYSSQELPQGLDANKTFLAQLKINQESAALYDKAVEEYKQVIDNIPKIADKLGVDMFAAEEPPAAEMDTMETAGQDSLGAEVKRVSVADSSRELAIKFQEKAKDKVSELLYTEADLTSKNIDYILTLKSPHSDPFKSMIFKIQIIKQIKPYVEKTVAAHMRNVEEAQALGLSNKYVEESKRQILLQMNVVPQQQEKVVHNALAEYRKATAGFKDLVEKEFGAVDAQGRDYYVLQNYANQMIDLTNGLSTGVMDEYNSTLDFASENNIKNDLVKNTEDNMLRFVVEITDTMYIYSDDANQLKEFYRVRFDSTENYNYDDASTAYEEFYYSLTDDARAILERALEIKEEKDIKNLWANKILLRLIKIDPVSYADNVEKDKILITSDDTWKATTEYFEEVWPTIDFDDSSWENAEIITSAFNQFSGLDVNPSAIWVKLASSESGIMQDSLSMDADTFGIGLSDSAAAGSDSLGLAEGADTLQNAYDTFSSSDSMMAGNDADTLVFFRKGFEINGTPLEGNFYVTADNDFRIYLNGEYLLDDEYDDYARLDTLDYYTFDIILKQGKNVIGIDVEDKDHSRQGLKFYGYIEVLPADITASAEEKAKVKKIEIDPIILKKVNILNKNRISVK